MADPTATAAVLAAGQAQESDLVALKRQVDRLRGDLTPQKTGQQKLRKACQDFEAVFISKMWEQMRATVPKEGYLHSPQEDMYRSMFDRDFAEKMANDGGIGLGDMMYSQLKDKLKNAAKSTAPDGSATADKSSAMPLKPLRSDAAQIPLDQRPALKPPKLPNQGIALQRKAEAPLRPVSVPTEVMGEVDALARRIEEDYARRQQAAAVSQGQAGGYARSGDGSTQAAGTGRKIATIG